MKTCGQRTLDLVEEIRWSAASRGSIGVKCEGRGGGRSKTIQSSQADFFFFKISSLLFGKLLGWGLLGIQRNTLLQVPS